MTIDTRHWVYCSLGPLSAEASNFSDDHLQGGGGGVIMTKGTINLHGIFRPVPGTEVWVAVSDGQNWIARIPRKLRVMNSFADPLRNITTVLVGCKFAYMENRKPPVNNLTEPEANTDIPEVDRRAFSQSIRAATVAQHILDNLGLTAAGVIPFTNSKIVDEWDLSGGFVQELGRLAEAECYRCRINENEQVEFISLNQEGGTGRPLITQEELIDITPQTVGELPADSVYAKYESTQLKPPDNDPNNPDDDNKRSKRNWERDESYSKEQYIHTYTLPSGDSVQEKGYFNRTRISESKYDLKDRVTSRTETSTELMGTRESITTFEYESKSPIRDPITNELPPTDPSKDYSVVKRETYKEKAPLGDIAGSCGFDGAVASHRGLGNALSTVRVTIYDRDKQTGISKTLVENSVQFISTPFGSDTISKVSQEIPDKSDMNWLALVVGVINQASLLVRYGDETRIRTEREFGLQKRPSQQERNKSADQKAPSVEQKGEIVWAVGSVTSQTALELSPPYVSDDRILKLGPGQYAVQKSDAAQKALNYATIENRLLLANRAGAGVQLRPIDVPPKPFDLFYIRLNGCTAAYRVNGTSWTFNSDGVVVSTDGLFWGAIDGQVDKAWFPLPPGVTALPANAAVTTNANPRPANSMAIPSGFNSLNPNLSALFAALPMNQAPVYRAIINPNIMVKPYTETITLVGGVQIGGGFEEQLWLPTEQEIGGGVKIGGGFELVTPIGTGFGVKEIAILGTELGIRDDLPASLLQFYQFNSATYDPNGYTFDDLFILTIEDDFPSRFRRFEDISVFLVSYDATAKRFEFNIDTQITDDLDRITFALTLVDESVPLYVKKYGCTPVGFDLASWTIQMNCNAVSGDNDPAPDPTANYIHSPTSSSSYETNYTSGQYAISELLVSTNFLGNGPPDGYAGATTPGGFRIYIEFF
jgi:hypothetical protein